MSSWSLVYEDFDPRYEGVRETLCTLGNGYFATRGAGAESRADEVHYPGCYLAGCYNRLTSEVAGRSIENEDLVNLPNWLPFTFRLPGGEWFHLAGTTILDYRQELDLRIGVLERRVRFEDHAGRITRLTHRRLVHMGQPHLAAQEMVIEPENWSGQVEIHSAIDGRVTNAGVARYSDLDGRHLEPVETAVVKDDTILLKARTRQSHVEVAVAARTWVLQDGGHVPGDRRNLEESGYVAQDFALHLSQGETAKIEKIVALYSSRDQALSECGLQARQAVARAGSFDELLQSHAEAWDFLWEQFDVGIELSEGAQEKRAAMVLRLHLFHLLQSVSLHSTDLDIGVPARGWHGEAYRGHIFWDELFIFPILNLRMPEITRGLLKYRYRRLDEARAAAAHAGLQGAMYPWQSASDGREETQVYHLNPKSQRWLPDNSHLQRHVNGAIAYNVWQYYQATADMEFLSFFGAEMLLEIARFWASIASYNPSLDRYEILGVMGPDEYHDGYPDREEPGLNNNAYTNVLAVWTLCRAVEALELLPADHQRKLCARLHLEQEEIDVWREISRKLRLVFHEDGVLSQFEGYEDLAEFDWQGYADKYGDIKRLDRILEAEGDTANRYKASKQADVLMLFYLFSAEELGELFTHLGYDFDPEVIPRTIDYYLKRTSHGSTLSNLVHSWVLARADRTVSWQLFIEALESDVANNHGGTTREGIHLGAMAGTADLIQRCYAGIAPRGEVLWFNPSLPDELRRLDLKLRYRGHSLQVEVTPDALTIRALRCAAETIDIGVDGGMHRLKAGETKRFALDGGEPAPVEGTEAAQ